MAEDRQTWIRHCLYLTAFTAVFHVLQFVASALLFWRLASPALLTFGLDALVSARAALILATRIARTKSVDAPNSGDVWQFRIIAVGYVISGLAGLAIGVVGVWRHQKVTPNLLGVALAAVSMLAIPIIGSYMKALAVELRSQAMKATAVFTFGNSYLSMVLLISQLVSVGMGIWWGEPLGALVMVPFMVQKGIQIVVDEGKHEYVED